MFKMGHKIYELERDEGGGISSGRGAPRSGVMFIYAAPDTPLLDNLLGTRGESGPHPFGSFLFFCVITDPVPPSRGQGLFFMSRRRGVGWCEHFPFYFSSVYMVALVDSTW